MPLPFVLVGAALLAGGVGAKKGKDAYDDFKDAKGRNELAERRVRQGESVLEEARDSANLAMERLGGTKFKVYKKSILPFVETFNRIKAIDFDDNDRVKGDMPAMDRHSFNTMYDSTLNLSSMLQGGLGSMGGGALAGLATYGGVGYLGTASTGAAISGLSGAAATNATLAWLGGGSLASGGFGMAGGMAVLGGVVAGPVLAVGGIIAASKAKESLENARSNLAAATTAKEQMLAAADSARGIERRFGEIKSVIQRLDQIFQPMLDSLKSLVDTSQNYPSYTEEQKCLVFTTASLAKLLKTVMEYELIDKDGALTQDSRNAVEEGQKTLQELKAPLEQVKV